MLFDSVERRKRIAVLALRRGGSVTATDGLHVEVKGHFWFEKPQKQKGSPAAEQRLVSAAALQTALGQASVETRETSWFRSVTATIVTDNPRQALLAMHTEATALGCHLAIWVDDLEPLRWALGRLMAEVERPSW